MRPGIDSAAGMGGLAHSTSERVRDSRWPMLGSVAFVIAFNIFAWCSIALGLYAVL